MNNTKLERKTRIRKNSFKTVLPAKSVNESFSRVLCSAFISALDPTLEEICDIKTAVSEAVTNCIVHAYPDGEGTVYIDGTLYDGNIVKIRIRDRGIGIADVKKAMEPLFTTAGGDRSGLGFSVMESFSDKVSVRSFPDKGTLVTLTKKLAVKEKR